MKTDFRFSPRPNRAHEINWRPWDDKAFTEALVEDRPVFLCISAVWCRRCHVMDETSFSDSEVIRVLNESYIPIRLDPDRRPDVNERYHRGSLPSTVILTPKGRTVTGGAYVPPDRLKQVLAEFAGAWREKREEFRRAEDKPCGTPEEPPPAPSLDISPYDRTLKALKRAYDFVYAGFGRDAKFTFPQALELALHAAWSGPDSECLKVATSTLMVMAGSPLYDAEEGGFFRYSANREWTLPQYEKILSENAALLSAYLRGFQITGELRFADMARGILAYLESRLFNPDGTWAGSQYADEEYYALPYADRRRRTPPPVDRTVFTNQDAALISALSLATWVLDEDRWQRLAAETAEVLWQRSYREGRGLAHYHDAEGPELFGRLDDHAAFGRALLSLYSGTGDGRWLERSRLLAGFCLAELRAPDGSFYDAKPDSGAVGELSKAYRNVGENGLAARWLLELSVLSGDERYAEAAKAALQALTPVFEREGLAGADFAHAVWESLHPWTTVTVVGKKEEELTFKLHRQALAVYVPCKTVRLCGQEDTGTEKRDKPYAVVRSGAETSPPVSEPGELVRLLRPMLC
jgi:hypothetical protein